MDSSNLGSGGEGQISVSNSDHHQRRHQNSVKCISRSPADLAGLENADVNGRDRPDGHQRRTENSRVLGGAGRRSSRIQQTERP